MTTVLAAAKAPDIDWAALSPLLALLGGAVVVLMVGLFRARLAREQLVPFLSLVAVGAAIGLTIWQWDDADRPSSAAPCGSTRWPSISTSIILRDGVRGDPAVLAGRRAA